MPKSRGKKFESEVSQMLKSSPLIAFYYRPSDIPPDNLKRFTPTSPIDFYCYLVGGQGLVIECKAVKGKSLPFKRFPERQWNALAQCEQGRVPTFVLINHYGYPGRDGQRGRVWAIRFWRLMQLREQLEGKRKSWPLSELEHTPQLVKAAGSWEWSLLQP